MAEETRLLNLGFVNAYLVPASDGWVLIDTGIAQQWNRLESELLQAGCLPSGLKLVIITHGDTDHAGNCAELQRKYGARIALHAGDLPMVTTGAPVKRRVRSFLGKLILWLGSFMAGKFTCFQPDILLEDGQDLSGYGLDARVLHTPGHTPGSIAVLTGDRQLFAGDTVDNRTRPARAASIEDEQALQASLVKLKQTMPKIVYPGHGEPFSPEALASLV